jgi:hypothetical protein
MTTRGFRTKNTAELLQAVYFMYRCSWNLGKKHMYDVSLIEIKWLRLL